MNFVSLEFAFFFLLVLLGNALVQQRPYLYKPFLLACNLAFYAWACMAFVPLLLVVAILNWGTARLLYMLNFPPRPGRNQSPLSDHRPGLAAALYITADKRQRSRNILIILNIVAHICLLGFFKYYEFVLIGLESLGTWLGLGSIRPGMALQLTDIIFPIGLSFYTFQGLSYAVDQYRRPNQAPQSFEDVLLFVSFFPCIMAGPIMRGKCFFPQLAPHPTNARVVQEGFALILSGLFKKIIIASYLSEHIVHDVFLMPECYSSWAVLAAVYAYAVQIFCDFSGYSDMAIGIGRLLGYTLPENFHSPYLACNLQDFWRRWHITLSLWLRDYLYIPLGGSKRGNRSLNLIITMCLGGLWHGAHTRFLLWGLLHGLGLAIVHAFQQYKQQRNMAPKNLPHIPTPVVRIVAWLLTFHYVTLLWVFFRAEDMDRSLEIFRRIFLFGQPGDGFPVLVLLAIAVGLFVQVTGRRIFMGFIRFQEKLPWYIQACVLSLLAGLILKMGPDGVMPFIYFQF